MYQSLHWRHNECDGVSNHRRLVRLLRRMFKSKKISKLCHGPLWGESTGERWIPLTKGPVTQRLFPIDDVIMIIGGETFCLITDWRARMRFFTVLHWSRAGGLIWPSRTARILNVQCSFVNQTFSNFQKTILKTARQEYIYNVNFSLYSHDHIYFSVFGLLTKSL